MSLISATFPEGGEIPRKHTRLGENLSPTLQWGDPPEGTQSFALFLDDPDAPSGVFKHWGVWDIDAGRRDLPEGADDETGLNQARNDFDNVGYDGPEPPGGEEHTYRFTLMALDTPVLEVGPEAHVNEVKSVAGGHAIETVELHGRFGRASTGF